MVAVLKVGTPSPPSPPPPLALPHTKFSKLSNRFLWEPQILWLETKNVRLYFARPGKSLKRSSTVPLVTDDHGPRTVKSQLITCHMVIALHWAIFMSAEIAMSFHPPLARP